MKPMLEGVSKPDIYDMVQRLDARKRRGQPTVLVLGSQAGGFFHSQSFYENLSPPSTRNLRNLSPKEQFRECHRTLVQWDLNDIHNFLVDESKKIPISEADACLAELVKQNVFNVVISTNIDDFLERAFNQEEMQELQDFEVWTARPSQPRETAPLGIRTHRKVIKAFGDLNSRGYNVKTRYSQLEDDKELAEILATHLKDAILVIGFDPVWDDGLIKAFPVQGYSFWYVNEEELAKDSLLIDPLKSRDGSMYIAKEPQGSYENFIKTVHWNLLGGRPPLNYQLIRNFSKQLQAIGNKLDNLPTIQQELVTLRVELQKLSKPGNGQGGDTNCNRE